MGQGVGCGSAGVMTAAHRREIRFLADDMMRRDGRPVVTPQEHTGNPQIDAQPKLKILSILWKPLRKPQYFG